MSNVPRQHLLAALRKQAEELAHSAHWDTDALALNLIILSIEPNAQDALTRAARCLRELGHLSSAAFLYWIAARCDPRDRVALNGLEWTKERLTCGNCHRPWGGPVRDLLAGTTGTVVDWQAVSAAEPSDDPVLVLARGAYWPKRTHPNSHERDSLTQAILRLKKGDPSTAAEFSEDLNRLLYIVEFHSAVWLRLKDAGGPVSPFPWKVVSIPGAKQGKPGATSWALRHARLATLPTAPVSDCLQRVRSIRRSHFGAKRDVKTQYDTLEISGDLEVAGKWVILLDDVLTTGSTLVACARRLKEAGASCIAAVVLGRTVP